MPFPLFRRRFRAGVAVLVAVASLTGAAPATAPTARRPRFIVVVGDTADAARVAAEHAARYHFHVRYVYRRALHGYAATMTAATASRLRRDATVSVVERDRRVRVRDGRV